MNTAILCAVQKEEGIKWFWNVSLLAFSLLKGDFVVVMVALGEEANMVGTLVLLFRLLVD